MSQAGSTPEAPWFCWKLLTVEREWKHATTLEQGRRYSGDEKVAAVRMVRTLRAELGISQGTVQRVADQLG